MNKITRRERDALQKHAAELVQQDLSSRQAEATLIAKFGVSKDRTRAAVAKALRVQGRKAMATRQNWIFIAPPNEAVEKSLGIGRCGVCGRALTDPESVAKGIGPVCEAHGVAKHMGPGPHPSGSPQSVHAGGKGKRGAKAGGKGMPLLPQASARVAQQRGMSGRDWMDRAQKLFRKPAYSRAEMSDAWEIEQGKKKSKAGISLKLLAFARVAVQRGERGIDWMNRMEKVLTEPLYTRRQLSDAWEAELKRKK